ncbi:MAG: heavy metal translocating P-type ATPase [Legionellales bacterium]|jgi:heavy metal translocating P-type ATPase
MLNQLKQYPLPLLAALGLVLGIVAKLIWPSESYAHFIWLLNLICLGAPLVFETFKKMFQKKFSVDIIASLAIITAFIMGETFTGSVIVLMQSSGEALEKFAFKRAMFTLDGLLSRAPKMAIRINQGQQENIPVQDIQVGDLLLIRPGDMIPVDGIIVEGEGEIDEAIITGEPFTRFVKTQQTLLSGSILSNGALTLRADKISNESQYAKIVQLVEKAHQEKAPIQRLADRYAIFFTPLTLLIASLGYFITQDFTTVLAVLVVATPCPLILATPIAVISGINRAAAQGIIVKGGIPLEKIAKVDVVVFDKTGTITEGIPQLEKIIVFNEQKYTADDVLYRAAIIEQRSSHAVAKAVTIEAIKKFNTLPQPLHLNEIPGAGLSGEWENEQIAVGTIDYISKLVTNMPVINQEEKLMAAVCVNKECIGILYFADKPKSYVKSMIEQLKTLGIKHIIMLTGDNKNNAQRIAQEVGIHHYHAELHPEEKVKKIAQIARQHPYTLMVGDGINDAPALANAYVGMAIGTQGVAIAAQAADIVLLEEDMRRVANAVQIGQRMLRVARQGILIGMGLSFVLMCIAAFGYISPPIGAILQEIIDVCVMMNALRARK